MIKSPEWVRRIAQETGLDDDAARRVFRAVLQALRDELAVEQNERLAPQMPPAVRELYFEGWSPAFPAAPVRDAGAFLERVRERFGSDGTSLDFAKIIRGVLLVVERRMPEPSDKIKRLLPKDLRALWPSTIAEQTLERHEELLAQQRAVQAQAQHAEAGHERGAPMAPHQNRTPGDEHRGGPLPNRM
jgi:uncharacterized protein (DUF2267 family)